MKRNTISRVLCLLLTALLLMGCQAPPQEVIEAVPQVTVSEPEMPAIFDAALREGKLACFFLKGDNDWSAAEEGEHSGDTVLFIQPDGTTVLYDCDTPNNGADIVYALQQLGISKIDHFVNSHPHFDHMGGFSIIARHIEIGHIYGPDVEMVHDGANTPFYKKMMQIAEEKNIPVTRLKAGDTLTLGSMEAKVYNPTDAFDPNTMNYNESSLVMKLTYKDSSFMLAGDTGNSDHLGQKTETLVVEKYGDELQCDIAKLNHHGEPSTQSQSEGWIQSVQAKAYVGTMSNIPNDVEYFRLLKMAMETGAQLLHTGIDGHVLITTAGDGTYDIYTAKERTTDYYGTLDMAEGHIHVE